MTEPEEQIIHKATFNDAVRIYILLYVAGFLLITVVGIPLMIIWLCGVGQWYSRHYFDKLDCVLSTKNLRFKKGIIVQFEKTIPLENIQDVSFIEGPLLRHFNLAVLKVETAGGAQHYGNHMRLVGVIDAHQFRMKVLEQRSLLKQKQETAGNPELMVEIRDSLLRIEELLKKK